MSLPQLILGPMFSAKSTELIRVLRRYSYAEKTTLIVQYAHDKRYSDSPQLVTHDRVMYGQTFLCTRLSEIPAEKLDGVDVIGIDEGQFFDDIYDFCMDQIRANVKLVITALNGRANLLPWDNISKIIPLCQITHLTAICKCGKKAGYTMDMHDPTNVDSMGIKIGGSERYRAVCSAHHPLFLKGACTTVPTLEEDVPCMVGRRTGFGDATITSVTPLKLEANAMGIV